MSVRLGARFGPYEVLGLIGSGGMGEVYKARDTRLDRSVAIKVLASDLAADPERRQRFEREAKTISALNHPHICTLYDMGRGDGIDYLVLEYLEGQTLRDRLASGSLDLRQAIGYAIEVADALAEAHRCGFVHRDLKPSNIMLTASGVKLLDFGIAKFCHAVSPAAESTPTTSATGPATSCGVFMGTLPYAAPEQIQGRPVDARTDLFSFGSVLFEMLTGTRAFSATDSWTVVASILGSRPPHVRDVCPGIPAALDHLVDKCLAKCPDERPQTAASVADELRATVRRLSGHEGGRESSLERRVSRTGYPKASGRDIRALAVLPLDNLSGDPSQDYFVDGMTEAVIASLAGIRGLRVISRTSVMRYKGTRRTLPEIARELNVDGIVEGSVSRSENRVRVTTQLIHAPSDSHVWTESYSRELADILSVQDEVAEAVARSIQLELSRGGRLRSRSARKVHEDAFEAYLRGRFALQNSGPVEESRAAFVLALKHDPTLGEAEAGLAEWYLAALTWRKVRPEEAIRCAGEALERALAIDHRNAEAYAALGRLRALTWAFKDAEAKFRRALQLRPGCAQAVRSYASLLTYWGRHNEAIRQAQKALKLDPVSAGAHSGAAIVLYSAGRYDDALEQCRRALELNPHFAIPHYYRGLALMFKGAHGEALVSLMTSLELTGGHTSVLAGLVCAHVRAGRMPEARAALERLVERASYQENAAFDPVSIAEAHASLGEFTLAFDWLERAFNLRHPDLAGLKSDPVLEPLRRDWRFDSLVRRMGLWPAHDHPRSD